MLVSLPELFGEYTALGAAVDLCSSCS
jgi:hypothetical protein